MDWVLMFAILTMLFALYYAGLALYERYFEEKNFK